ncbi:unnamed protein product, partial [Trichogramma brassicae]
MKFMLRYAQAALFTVRKVIRSIKVRATLKKKKKKRRKIRKRRKMFELRFED